MLSLIDADGASELGALTLLAIVQGLTEFLPVSSSGHLVLVQEALEFEEPALVLEVALHVGTLLAVVAVYWRDVLGIVVDMLRGRWHEARLLVVGSIPAGVIGVLFKDQLAAAFERTEVAAGGLLVTSAMLLLGEWTRRRNLRERAESGTIDEHGGRAPAERMTWQQALLIGCFQAGAICPGVSRSGSTIVAGLLCRLSAAHSARFSFLLSIPAIGGAAVLSVPDALDEGFGAGLGAIALAALLAGVVGWVALRVLIAFLGRGVFVWFAAYCALLGLSVFAFVA